MSKILVLVPTYNEAESIKNLLIRLDQTCSTFTENEIDILIIDDKSPDGTADIAKSLDIKRLSILRRDSKNGLGPAYIAGFKYGLERGYDFFVEMDADLSHQPEELGALFKMISAQNFVIGTRWMPGGSVVNWPKKRQFISKMGTRYASFALGLPFRDLTSGYRVIPKSFLNMINLDLIETKGYGFQIEMAMLANKLGFSIKEVPITFVERENGLSKMSLAIVWEAWFMVTFWGLRRLILRR
jgi:dolichol-phosphate mannosyltransferase